MFRVEGRHLFFSVRLYNLTHELFPVFLLSARDQLWVRRFYILLRREQIDEMDGGASNVVHELCTFQTDTEFSECLSSIILEEVIKFEVGPEAGLPGACVHSTSELGFNINQCILVACACEYLSLFIIFAPFQSAHLCIVSAWPFTRPRISLFLFLSAFRSRASATRRRSRRRRRSRSATGLAQGARTEIQQEVHV